MGYESNAYWTRCKITSCSSVGFASVEIVLRDAFYDSLSSSGVVYPSRSPQDRAADSLRKQQDCLGSLIHSRGDWKMNLHCAASRNDVRSFSLCVISWRHVDDLPSSRYAIQSELKFLTHQIVLIRNVVVKHCASRSLRKNRRWWVSKM